MKRWWIAAVAIVGASSFAREAHAQYWLGDRTLQEGRGIRTGNFELHPGIGVEGGYDSNVFYSSVQPTPAFRIRVTPSISISTLGPQRTANSDSTPTALPTVNFRGGVALVYHEFVPLQSPDTVSRLRNLGAQANIRIDLFPQRTWQFSIADEFTRTIQPGPQLEALPSGTTAANTSTFNRDYNHASAELVYAPGHSIFELRFGYALNVSAFEDSAYTRFNYLQHEASVRMRWRFLPKTALLWEGSVTPLSYSDGSGGVNGLFSSTPVRTRVGLNGLLTEKLGLLVMVGYGATFFSGGDNQDTVIGQAELRWIINPLSTVRVGFNRDLENSFFGNYFLRDRGYLTYTQSFSGKFLLSIDGGISLLDYGYVADRTGSPLLAVAGVDPTSHRFSAVRVDGTIFGEYRISDIFGINATLQASSNISDARLGTNTVGADGAPGQAISWTRLNAFLGVRANW